MPFDGLFRRHFRREDNSSKTNMTEWQKACTARAEKYGYSKVPAAVVYTAFAEIVKPSTFGFAPMKSGLVAAKVSDDIFHVIELRSGKGDIYSFRWGVSLAYVPHDWCGKCTFHRTLKSVHLDLFEDAGEFLVRDPYSAEGWQYYTDSGHGEICMREDLARAWCNLKPIILHWFDTVSNLEGILDRATAHVNHSWQSFRHHPDPKLVSAFTLARLGRVSEGKNALEDLMELNRETYCSIELRGALDKTPKT